MIKNTLTATLEKVKPASVFHDACDANLEIDYSDAPLFLEGPESVEYLKTNKCRNCGQKCSDRFCDEVCQQQYAEIENHGQDVKAQMMSKGYIFI